MLWCYLYFVIALYNLVSVKVFECYILGLYYFSHVITNLSVTLKHFSRDSGVCTTIFQTLACWVLATAITWCAVRDVQYGKIYSFCISVFKMSFCFVFCCFFLFLYLPVFLCICWDLLLHCIFTSDIQSLSLLTHSVIRMITGDIFSLFSLLKGSFMCFNRLNHSDLQSSTRKDT